MKKQICSFILFTILSTTYAQLKTDKNLKTKCWQPVDLLFESGSQIGWDKFPLQVRFVHEGSKRDTLTLDGFWTGGNNWTVRFAPTLPGVWKWESISSDKGLKGQRGEIISEKITDNDIIGNPNYRGQVKVISDGTHFEYADGTPILILGDTNWAINTARCGILNGHFIDYLEDRRAKKLNTILIRYFGVWERNEGGYPYLGNAPKKHPSNVELQAEGPFDKINPEFWKWMDYRMQKLWEAGMIVAGHPTWFADINVTLQQAKDISRYILARYGAYNLIYSLSGEFNKAFVVKKYPVFQDVKNWNSLGYALETINNKAYKIPMSAHQGWETKKGKSSSSDYFHQETWLDHNWIQSGQGLRLLTYDPQRVLKDYKLKPRKPVLHMEGWYEDAEKVYKGARPVSNPRASAFDLRWQVWSALLNGASGACNGTLGIHKFYDPNDKFGETGWDDRDPKYWKEALKLPGMGQLHYILNIFNSFQWWKLQPCREKLLVNLKENPWPNEDDLAIPEAAEIPGERVIIYLPEKTTLKVIQWVKDPDEEFTGKWLNPRTGEIRKINGGFPLMARGKERFTLPEKPNDKDWVLVLLET